MDKQIISFRIDTGTLKALDSLTEALDRDRSYLLNDAVRVYLDVQKWQVAQIREGVRQANQGKLIGHEEVRKRAARWRRR